MSIESGVRHPLHQNMRLPPIGRRNALAFFGILGLSGVMGYLGLTGLNRQEVIGVNNAQNLSEIIAAQDALQIKAIADAVGIGELDTAKLAITAGALHDKYMVDYPALVKRIGEGQNPINADILLGTVTTREKEVPYFRYPYGGIARLVPEDKGIAKIDNPNSQGLSLQYPLRVAAQNMEGNPELYYVAVIGGKMIFFPKKEIKWDVNIQNNNPTNVRLTGLPQGEGQTGIVGMVDANGMQKQITVARIGWG